MSLEAVVAALLRPEADIHNVDLAGKTVLVRNDFNVPVDEQGHITGASLLRPDGNAGQLGS
jgi:hypothetical protein